jgi:hypothetical protein
LAVVEAAAKVAVETKAAEVVEPAVVVSFKTSLHNENFQSRSSQDERLFFVHLSNEKVHRMLSYLSNAKLGTNLRFASGLALFHGVKCHFGIVAVHSVNERRLRAKRKRSANPKRSERGSRIRSEAKEDRESEANDRGSPTRNEATDELRLAEASEAK